MRADDPNANPALVFLVDEEDPIHALHSIPKDSYVYVLEGEEPEQTMRYIPWHRVDEVVRGEACEVFEA